VSITLRVTEIQRVLKETGSFYLHCDPTASHYLKLVLDAVFCTQGGDFGNEIVWCYKSGGASKHHFAKKHDIIFRYTKSNKFTFNYEKEKSYGETGGGQGGKVKYYEDELGTYSIVGIKDWWPISMLATTNSERLGYPTQKPETLLTRIVKASSNEGDLVLDAYCGCGTTTAVAQEQKRKWIGIDITYQSIALILYRLEKQFGKGVASSVKLDGIPRDMASAQALANKKDDRVRKEFEKWAVMTYTGNRAIIHQKKGADAGIDGIAYFRTSNTDNAKIILQVKSGNVQRDDIAKLRGDMQRESAAMAVFITLEAPTAPMFKEAKGVGLYHHDLMDRNYDAIQIVTIQDMIENGKVLDIPMSLEVLKAAQLRAAGNQLPLLGDTP
jgi:site-specific DNA-methyltransferase (adenine-specific)